MSYWFKYMKAEFNGLNISLYAHTHTHTHTHTHLAHICKVL